MKSIYQNIRFFNRLATVSILAAININAKSDTEVDKVDYYLHKLDIKQSEQSKDFVENQTQFQLHNLMTEQSHPKTIDLTYIAKNDPAKALQKLFEIDKDIVDKINTIDKSDSQSLNNIIQAVTAVKNSILQGNKIYVYGTGSTGRLAKQIENIWRSFWINAKKHPDIMAKLKKSIPNLEHIENAVIGEITGADRALIKSLEGFEDLQQIGKLQLDDHKITGKDVIFAITEGGETSAVIGAALAGKQLNHSRANNLYFVYNNPNKVLMPFDRSRSVLTDNAISKINFTTGVCPGNHGMQAITGSTRMQATSSQTFLIGIIIQQAVEQILRNQLSNKDLRTLGFNPASTSLLYKLKTFKDLRLDVEGKKSITAILDVANIEYETYKGGGRTFYFGNDFLTTLFIDLTERAPTFNLAALDSITQLPNEAPSSWVQIYTEASNLDEAWQVLLGRNFQGLDKEKYESEFKKIDDPYLKKTVLQALNNATSDQGQLYDFSIKNLERQKITSKDTGIAYLSLNEADQLLTKGTQFRQWLKKLQHYNCKIIVLVVGHSSEAEKANKITKDLHQINSHIKTKILMIKAKNDPMQIQQKLALKLFLNSQSTLVMARLGRILGNSMIYVYPSNLKLTGRATFLTKLHINAIIKNKQQFNNAPEISYNDANALLFDAVKYVEDHQRRNKVAVIPLIIIRVLESLQHNNPSSWTDADKILEHTTLDEYINKLRY